jgi:hypothetical protein
MEISYVYVVTNWYPYEGEEIQGIYSSEELAEKYHPELVYKRENYNGYYQRRLGPYWECHKMELITETTISEGQGAEAPTVGEGPAS